MNDFPTLRELLEEAVRAEPRDHVFARWHEGGAWRTRTYAETLERVRALSEWFGNQGLVPHHTHVALLLPNSPEWLEIYLAIVGLAGTVVPIDPKLTPAELHHILSRIGTRRLVISYNRLVYNPFLVLQRTQFQSVRPHPGHRSVPQGSRSRQSRRPAHSGHRNPALARRCRRRTNRIYLHD